MKKVFFYTVFLLSGLLFSQTYLPALLKNYSYLDEVISFLTYTGLAYIMLFVGLEFNLKKSEIKSYKLDYIVAFTAATFPWILTALYFLFTQYSMGDWFRADTWKEILFVGRFAAPTSAGILFAMLAAAGLAGTWVYKKIRVLAIFDDLDTVLLLIPLKIMVIGMAWQLGVVLAVMIGLCALGWVYLRRFNIPVHGVYPMLYSVILALFSQALYLFSKGLDPRAPIHIEVLFPAFILGLMISLSDKKMKQVHAQESSLSIVGGIFMILVGLNMPYVLSQFEGHTTGMWVMLSAHVLMVTILSNIGKMYVLFNYQDESTFKERLAVGFGMLPRGEVGAGVLIMAIGLGFSERLLTIAMASLVLNFILTGVFIYIVKRLTTSKIQEVKKEKYQQRDRLVLGEVTGP